MTSGALDEIMLEAFASQREGRLSDAECACRQILSREPRHAEALHLLGTLAGQTGHPEIAIQLIRRSIAVDPNRAEPYNNLGVALEGRGRFEEAGSAYRKALEIAPAYSEARYNLANVLEKLGQIEAAVAEYRGAILLNPAFVQAWNNLARALLSRGKFGEAAEASREALRLDPLHAAARHNLGTSLQSMGALGEATAEYREAVRLAAGRADFQRSLGSALHGQKAYGEAITAYREALRIVPDDAITRFNLGCSLQAAGLWEEAIAEYRSVIEAAPDFAPAHLNLGHALQVRGKADAAEEASRKAILLAPKLASGYANLGNALKDKGCIDEAIRAYRKAIELKPDAAAFHSNLVYLAVMQPASDAAAIVAEAREWDRRHAAPLWDGSDFRERDRDPQRRLRVGYVSPDFRQHPVGENLWPLLREHDHERFEIFGYSDAPKPDAVTDRIRSCMDGWREIYGTADETVARAVREDRIDILVDLSLHMSGNRLLVFARKAAPLQVTYLGYCGTTGLRAMDYRFSDWRFDPANSDLSVYSEETIRLPHCYWCYHPAHSDADCGLLPAAENGCVTFGCLNNFAKISPDALDVWLQILLRKPGSRLLLYAPEGSSRESILARGRSRGIHPERFDFVDRQPLAEYFETWRQVDIALDPFPCSGGITSCDALWMGAPVVTLAGRTSVGRAGASILSTLGMPELIAETPEEYVAIAVRLADDLPRLRELRFGLRQRMEQSPLRDGRSFARDIEFAYRQIWRTWCSKATSDETPTN